MGMIKVYCLHAHLHLLKLHRVHLQVELQRIAEEENCQALDAAMGLKDVEHIQKTLDKISKFYRNRCAHLNYCDTDLPQQTVVGWIFPAGVQKRKAAATMLNQKLQLETKPVMDARGARIAANTAKRLLRKAIEAGCSPHLLQHAGEHIMEPDKEWPGGRAPLDLLLRLHEIESNNLKAARVQHKLDKHLAPYNKAVIVVQKLARGHLARGHLAHVFLTRAVNRAALPLRST